MRWYSHKPVVVTWDFSDMSRAGLEAAGEFVESGERIMVVHVAPRLRTTEPAVLWGGLDENLLRQNTRKRFEESVRGTKFEEIDFVVRIGDPGREICKFADEIGAGLVIIPSQGKGWVERMTIGSVAERVVRLAHCAVLILRGLDKPRDIKSESETEAENTEKKTEKEIVTPRVQIKLTAE